MAESAGVLVVEDNDALRLSYNAILRNAGYRVADAANGSEALQHLRTADFDAVLLDIAMPVLNGLEMLDLLVDPPPVVLITAREYDEQIIQRRSKVLLYLQKPVFPEVLLASIAQAVSTEVANEITL